MSAVADYNQLPRRPRHRHLQQPRLLILPPFIHCSPSPRYRHQRKFQPLAAVHGQKLHGVFPFGEGDVVLIGDRDAGFSERGKDRFAVAVVAIDDGHVAPRGAGCVGFLEVFGDVVGLFLNAWQFDEQRFRAVAAGADRGTADIPPLFKADSKASLAARHARDVGADCRYQRSQGRPLMLMYSTDYASQKL